MPGTSDLLGDRSPIDIKMHWFIILLSHEFLKEDEQRLVSSAARKLFIKFNSFKSYFSTIVKKNGET